MRRNTYILVSGFLLFAALLIGSLPYRPAQSQTNDIPERRFNLIGEPPATPKQYTISQPTGYLNYNGVIAQIKKWNQEAPEITEVGTYGKTTRGNEIYYIRTGKGGVKVLITACIHGNEKIANATMMGILGKYLHDYGRDPIVTRLIQEREVYWVPVVSPDSFIADVRHVDGVDPNRNFPFPGHMDVKSVAPIQALRDFFQQKQFKAAVSTHAYGRIYIHPWGYTNQPCPDHPRFSELLGKMAKISGYRSDQIRNLPTAPPYQGFEADWFYINGAFGMVAEVGVQFKPPESDIAPEVERNYKSYLLFIDEAPLQNLKGPGK